MTKEEFEIDVNKIIDILGKEALQFLTVTKKMEEFFLKADEAFLGSSLLLNEYEEIAESIKDVLGEEEGKRFFRAIYDTLPTQTVYYLSVLVKLFEMSK